MVLLKIIEPSLELIAGSTTTIAKCRVLTALVPLSQIDEAYGVNTANASFNMIG